MRILLLGFAKIAYMPYMNVYLETAPENVEFELVYWDRDGKADIEVPRRISRSYKFEMHLEEQLAFKNKLRYFIQYRKFALRVLKQNHYDKVIVLHTTPGLTLLDYLVLHYRKNYLLDFRDVSYEYMSVYRKLVGVLARQSAKTVVSSNAFRKFLPANMEIYTIHNYLEDSLNHIGIRSNKSRKRERLRIAFWGLVRQVDVNQKIMDALGNDERFELHYYGRMQQDGRDMEAYARQNKYDNVYFHGAYMPEDRYGFAAETELIHNVYDLGHTMGNAMGNKFYDGIIFRIPQICTLGSHMGDTVINKRVGAAISLESTSIADEIFAYYSQIDWDRFEDDCKVSLKIVLDEQKDTKEQIRSFMC